MKLSIITICYNNVDGLRQTLFSTLRSQGGFDDFEQIVVDGGSKDGTLDVIHEYEADLAWWCSEPDKGIYNAMNKGAEHATGDYLLFLNSGDILLEQSLEKVFAHEFHEDIVYSDIYACDGDVRLLKKAPSDTELTQAYLTINTLPHQAALIRRSLHDEIGGYDETMKISAAPKFILDAIVGRKCTTRYLEMAFSVFDRSGISSDIAFLPAKLREWQYLLTPYFGERVANAFFRAKMAEKILSAYVIRYASEHPGQILLLRQIFNDVTKDFKDDRYKSGKDHRKSLKEAQGREEKLKVENRRFRKEICSLRKEVSGLKRSASYRVGLWLTFPLRALYRSLKFILRNGRRSAA